MLLLNVRLLLLELKRLGAIREALGFLKSLLVLTEQGHGVDHLLTRQFNQGGDGPGAKTEAQGSEVHAGGHRGGVEELARDAVSNHDVLNVELGEEDDPEPEVGEGARKDVERGFARFFNFLRFFNGILCEVNFACGKRVKNSAVDHVEQVHHHEAVEHEGLVQAAVAHRAIWVCHLRLEQVVVVVADLGGDVEQQKHDDQLVEGLEQN